MHIFLCLIAAACLGSLWARLRLPALRHHRPLSDGEPVIGLSFVVSALVSAILICCQPAALLSLRTAELAIAAAVSAAAGAAILDSLIALTGPPRTGAGSGGRQ